MGWGLGVLRPSHGSYSKAVEGGTGWAVSLPGLDKASNGPIVLEALDDKSPLNSLGTSALDEVWNPKGGRVWGTTGCTWVLILVTSRAFIKHH